MGKLPTRTHMRFPANFRPPLFSPQGQARKITTRVVPMNGRHKTIFKSITILLGTLIIFACYSHVCARITVGDINYICVLFWCLCACMCIFSPHFPNSLRKFRIPFREESYIYFFCILIFPAFFLPSFFFFWHVLLWHLLAGWPPWQSRLERGKSRFKWE